MNMSCPNEYILPPPTKIFWWKDSWANICMSKTIEFIDRKFGIIYLFFKNLPPKTVSLLQVFEVVLLCLGCCFAFCSAVWFVFCFGCLFCFSCCLLCLLCFVFCFAFCAAWSAWDHSLFCSVSWWRCHSCVAVLLHGECSAWCWLFPAWSLYSRFPGCQGHCPRGS